MTIYYLTIRCGIFAAMDNSQILKTLLAEFWFAPGDVVLRYHEAVIGHAAPLRRPTLDVGCGDGKIAQHIFTPHLPMNIGLDPEPIGAEKSGSYKKVIPALASKMPIATGTIETVTSNSTFEHITDDEASIIEVARVLKKGGKLYLTVPHPALSKFLLQQTGSREAYVDLHLRIMHLHYRSPQEWQQIMEAAGLEVIEYRRYVSPSAGKIWYFFFKLATWRPYKRELWSYLTEKRFSWFLPVSLIQSIEAYLIAKASDGIWSHQGLWQYFVAIKKTSL